jgi:hypothetical protein
MVRAEQREMNIGTLRAQTLQGIAQFNKPKNGNGSGFRAC